MPKLISSETFPLGCKLSNWLSTDNKLEKFRITQFKQAVDLPPSWDIITQENPLLSRKHLSVLEQASENIQIFYCILLEQNIPVACFYFQLTTLSRRNYNKFSDKKWIDELFGCYINHRKYRLLTCGSLFHNCFQGIFARHDVAPDVVLSALCRAIDHIRCAKKVSAVLIKDVPAQMKEMLTLDYKGFEKLPEDISMEMEIPESWLSFSDYCHSLTSKYAARVRKARQALQPIVRREMTKPELAGYQNELHNLYLQVVDRQSIRIGIVQQNYWLALKQSLNDNFVVFGYFLDGNLVAFSTGYNFYTHFETHYIGFDTILNSQYSLYVNILLDAVADAIQRRCPKLILGRTALEAKAIIGCKPKPLTNVLRTHSSLLAWSVNLFYEWFQQGQNDSWKKRNPFKTS